MKTEVDVLYFDKFIESLENDYKFWTMRPCAGGAGHSWTEFQSPDYANGTGNKISFAFTLCNTGAYVNGYMSWTIPFLNPFSKKCRRFVRANNNMQKYLRQKAKDEYNQQLINALI